MTWFNYPEYEHRAYGNQMIVDREGLKMTIPTPTGKRHDYEVIYDTYENKSLQSKDPRPDHNTKFVYDPDKYHEGSVSCG